MEKLDRQAWAAEFVFVSFGMRIGVRVTDPEILRQFIPCLPQGWRRINDCSVDRVYSVLSAKGSGRRNVHGLHLLFAGIQNLVRTRSAATVLEALESDLSLYLAEASRRWSFVHAGVVSWNGAAIVLPGRSGSGKTTLVAEFLRAGAEYLSDEFAPIDSQGRVHPYPRRLSLRQERAKSRMRMQPELFGSKSSKSPLPVGFLIVTRYRPAARWRPHAETPGTAMLSLLENSLSARSVPFRTMARFALAIRRARILRGDRGDARETVRLILRWCEEDSVR